MLTNPLKPPLTAQAPGLHFRLAEVACIRGCQRLGHGNYGLHGLDMTEHIPV
jgi:hypothetical protein